MPSAYPTANDLQTYLTNAGLYDADQHPDLDALSKAAATAWERVTGWIPFLSSGTDAARTFIVQPRRTDNYLPRWASRRLFLQAGILSVTSITVNGTALTQGEDWDFLPRTGAEMAPPYTDIWLNCALAPVVITGKWGYCETLPDDVRQIILQAAAQAAFPQIEFASTGGVQSVQTLTAKVTFSGSNGSTFARTAVNWDSIYRDAVLDYKLVGMGR